MAGRRAIQEEEEEEPMVPVLSVIKNGAILKSIFVINDALPPFSSEEVVWPFDPMDDEVLIVGRHPDCNIMLTHPSISRFHLMILSNPTSRKLSVVDLSSVHGTWISDSRIDRGVLFELNEGDTIRAGGSSRVYRLHWIPLTHAYDRESPSVSAMDLAVIKEKEEENEGSEDVVLGEANQDDYHVVVESAKSTETKNAQATGEDEEISQNNDFSAAKGISKNSTDLTLEDSVASLPLHDLVKIGNSTEFLIPLKGNLSVDPFQIYSETNLDNPAHMSLCLSFEVPSSTDNQMCNEEQNKQVT